jgi:hypothetical protein
MKKAKYLYESAAGHYWVECIILGYSNEYIHLKFQDPFIPSVVHERLAPKHKVTFED